MRDPALNIHRVTKRFGAVAAVAEATVTVHASRLHAIVGENGAGKSTLLSVAGGILSSDSGEVIIEGRRLSPASPLEATRRGIGFVHQHFMLVDAFTVLENIMLGAEPTGAFGRLDRRSGRSQAERILREAELSLDLDAWVDRLGVGERQTLEIVRVLYRGARIILLDEPTAVLTPAQAHGLFGTLRKLVDHGAAIVVVTHRLSEVTQYCDDVTVMRRGEIVWSSPVSQTNEYELTRRIMGRDPPSPIVRPEADPSQPDALVVDSLSVAGQRTGRPAVEGVSLRIQRGWVVGIAGVEGNGQQELVQALAGLERPLSGSIQVNSRVVTQEGVSGRRKAGLVVMHSDRHRDGLVLEASVWDNLVLGDLGRVDERERVDHRIRCFDVRPAEPSLPVRALSGGNQQKVVTARTLDRELTAVVLAQPTRGVDLNAARAIHEVILGTARSGAGVLIVSADLSELRSLCHRIHVMARGRIVATLSPDASDETFGRAMLGLDGAGGQG